MSSPTEAEAADIQDQEAGIATLTSAWLAATGSRVKATADLALAEVRLAAISIAWMAFFATLASLFVFATWGLLAAGLVHGLVQLGAPLWLCLGGLGVLHALAGFIMWGRMLALSRYLEFPATTKLFKTSQEDVDGPHTTKTAS